MFTTLFATIFVLGILVFLHELGHFIVAKLVGIRVERFSIGFPPRLFGKKIGDTDYCLSAIPLGGYVKMSGMIDESMDKEAIQGQPWEFMSKPLPHRIATILAGPLMNYILAIGLFAGLIFAKGVGEIDGTFIGEVAADFPAQKAGIVAGDKIVSLNGNSVTAWQEMTEIIHSMPDQDITLEWQHEGQLKTATLHTRAEKAPIDGEIRQVGMIGVAPKLVMKKVGLLTAIGDGFNRSIYLTQLIVVSLKNLIIGKESLKSLGGPVMIAKLAGDSARSGWDTLLALMAFLSLNLAILNVLPIPALDGGHIMILLVEGVIRRPLAVKTRIIIQQVGMAILLALVIFVVVNDVRNWPFKLGK